MKNKGTFRPDWYVDKRHLVEGQEIWLPEAQFLACLMHQWNEREEGWGILKFDIEPRHLGTREGRWFYKQLLEYRNASRIFEVTQPGEFLRELCEKAPELEIELQAAIWPLFAGFTTQSVNHWARLTLLDFHEKARETLATEIKNRPEAIDELYEMNKLIKTLKSPQAEAALSNTAIMSAQNYSDLKEKQIEEGVGSKSVLKSGFEQLDDALSLKPGDLVVMGGRSGSGKSYLAIELARRYCERGKRVGFISLEMEEQRLVDGFMANITGINIDVLADPARLTFQEKIELQDASYLYEAYSIAISDKRSVNLSEMRRIILSMERQLGGLDVIFLDHMHTVDDDVKGIQIREKLIAISKTIRAYAKEFKATFFALAQLNRSIDARQTPEHVAAGTHLPQVSDFRESSSIEQDADFILMIYRDNYQSQRGTGLTELYCRKSRYSGTGANWCVKFEHNVGTKTFREVNR